MMTINEALRRLADELSEEIPNLLTAPLTFGLVWLDLCRLAGEASRRPSPRWPTEPGRKRVRRANGGGAGPGGPLVAGDEDLRDREGA